jgi:hypothetical protein
VTPDARDMSDPTDVASDPATDADAPDDAYDNDDDARRISARRRCRREPCCRLVDVLRAGLVRGTCGIGGKCERRGGMRDARGSGDGVGGRALLLLPPPPLLLPLLRESEEEAPGIKGFGTPRMCTIPAPSCVSSSVQGFDVVDAADVARATAGADCCQSYAVTLGRTGAGVDADVAEVNAPSTLEMLFRRESRQASIVPGCGSAGCGDERSRRSFHLL